MADITQVRVGVCTVTFNGTDLGLTKGGVTVSYEPSYHDIAVDQYGETIVDSVLVGEKFSAKVPLAESTIANMKVAMPNGTFAGAANKRLTLGKTSGTRQSTLAAQLVLHPQNEGTRVNDVVIYKAFVNSTIELAHTIDGEKILEVEFMALLDSTKSDGNYLGLIGDST